MLLAEQTGLTTRLISEIANNKIKMYPKDALQKIMVALDVKCLSDIITDTFKNLIQF